MTYSLRQGHVLDRLREIESESVQTVVTSPPYWGLRAYGTEPQVWGGDLECEYESHFARPYIKLAEKRLRGARTPLPGLL